MYNVVQVMSKRMNIQQKFWISDICSICSIYFNNKYDDWNFNMDTTLATVIEFVTLQDFSTT